MGFIADLKEEHQQIVVLLDEIGSGRFVGEQLADKMAEWEEVLVKHVTKEDTQLHPVLVKAGESDEKLAELVNSSTTEMADVTICVVLFFQKFSGKAIQGPEMKKEFADDFKNLRDALLERVKVEENNLFAEYEKLSLKTP